MLKAPPVNARTYIYGYYNIDPTICLKICLEKVLFFQFLHKPQPILVELIVEHILRPQSGNSQICADLTDIVIISLTTAL